MTAHHHPDTLIQAFLDEGMTELPDRAFDAVRSDINRTRQRVVIGPWREPTMSTIARLAVAAVVVLAAGVAWANLGPPGDIGGRPTPPPTAIPTATPTATDPQLIRSGIGALAPGRYRFDYGAAVGSEGFLSGTDILITIPDVGWTNYESFAVDRNYGPNSADAGASLVMWRITNRYVNGCGDPTPFSPAPGPGLDEILETIANQPGIDAGPIEDVTVDGYAGGMVELTVTVDITTCPDGFYPWLDKFVQGNSEVLRVYALDVDGLRLTFFARITERTTPEHLAQLESIIASIDIQP